MSSIYMITYQKDSERCRSNPDGKRSVVVVAFSKKEVFRSLRLEYDVGACLIIDIKRVDAKL
jgi:hypothetical protein